MKNLREHIQDCIKEKNLYKTSGTNYYPLLEREQLIKQVRINHRKLEIMGRWTAMILERQSRRKEK